MRSPLRVWKDKDYMESNMEAAISLAEQIPGVDSQIKKNYSNPDVWDWAKIRADMSSVIEFYPEFTVPFEATYKHYRKKFQHEANSKNPYLARTSSKESLDESLIELKKHTSIANIVHFSQSLAILMATLQYSLTQSVLLQKVATERTDTESKKQILRTAISRIVNEIKSKYPHINFDFFRERIKLIPYEENSPEEIIRFFLQEIYPLFH